MLKNPATAIQKLLLSIVALAVVVTLLVSVSWILVNNIKREAIENNENAVQIEINQQIEEKRKEIYEIFNSSSSYADAVHFAERVLAESEKTSNEDRLQGTRGYSTDPEEVGEENYNLVVPSERGTGFRCTESQTEKCISGCCEH